MSPLALFDVRPLGLEIAPGLLGAGIVATIVFAWRSLRRSTAAGTKIDPWTRFLISAPKELGVLALVFGAFASVVEVERTTLNSVIWTEVGPLIAGSAVMGGAVALIGFLGSWVLEAIAGEEP